MKYIPIILVVLFFAVPGCVEQSPYKQVSPSQLVSSPGSFEGKQVCINGIMDNLSISGIFIETTGNSTINSFSRNSYIESGVFTSACGTYAESMIKADSVDAILSITTDKEIYHSNETLKAHVDFNSPDTGKGKIQVAGIRNEFDRALVNETREVDVNKGYNGFDFEFTTPSCEECSALKPGVYPVNATAFLGGKTFEAYRKITLERELK